MNRVRDNLLIHRERWLALAFVGIMLVLLAWKVYGLGHYRWYQDEGEYVSTAWLASQGQALYSDIFLPSPPLFILSLQLGMKLFGFSLYGARFIIALYAILGIVATSLIAREFGGWLAVFATAVLLSWNPEYFRLSRIAMSDVPGSALLMLAILFLLYYWRSRRRIWLLLSGLTKGLAILVKFVSAPALPLFWLALIVFWLTEDQSQPVRFRWRQAITDGLIWTGALLLPLIASALYYGPSLLWQHVLAFQWESRANYAIDVASHLQTLWEIVATDLGILGLAVFGAYCLLRRRDWKVVVPIVGSLLVTLGLLFQVPLSHHHLLPLIPFVAILSGIGLSETVSGWILWVRGQHLRLSRLALMIGLVLLVFAAVQLPTVAETNRRNRLSTEGNNEMVEDAMTFMQSITGPDDFVLSDDPLLVLLAGRRVFPELASVSSRRIQAGRLKASDLIALAEKDGYPPIVYWKDLFDKLDDFTAWVEAHYERLEMVEQRRIYVRRQQQFPQSRRVVEGVNLLYARAKDTTVLSDGEVAVPLIWQCQAPVLEDYLISVRLENGVHRVLARQNGRPHGGDLPTTNWSPGNLIYDPREIQLLPATPPGSYQVMLEVLRQDIPDHWQPIEAGEIPLGTVAVPRRPPPSVESLDIETEMNSRLGDEIQLLGYNLEGNIRPGSLFHLTLFWKVLNERRKSYTVFNQLIGPDGRIWGQKDNIPVDGFYPTDQWVKGEIVRDQYDISIAQEAPPGQYELLTGMYRADTGQRLQLAEESQSVRPNAILLDRVEIE